MSKEDTNSSIYKDKRKIFECLLAVLMFVFSYQVPAFSQGNSVTVNLQNATLRQFFASIEKQSAYRFLYREADIPKEANITLTVNRKNINEVLDQLLPSYSLSYSISGNKISITRTSKNASSGQSKQISGTVTDNKGEILIGASIEIVGTTEGTITDMDGKFTLTAPTDATLKVSYIGYESVNIAAKGRTTLSIVLNEGIALNEIVVTALGVKRDERALGYAAQKVEGSSFQTVKGVDMATSLTGKVAGLLVKNTTEFNGMPELEMRGETPLLVINGVPYQNLTLRDLASDDIESISMLKGPTAAALYGYRGSAGAVMVTTKGGKNKGLSVDINSNTMFNAGYLAIPESQTSYGRGLNGKLGDDYVWGPKLDIGQSAMQWNPKTKQEEMMPLVSSGKHNLRNFLETGLITNNNISITQTGENGFFRTSLNYIYNKGQYPNQHLNMFNYSVAGKMNIGDKFSVDSQLGVSYSNAPQTWGGGYDAQGYLYQIVMWTGPEYDIRDYRDYWVTPNQKQNWLYNAWYDNPYLIAYEKLLSQNKNKFNASINANYNFSSKLKLTVRAGYDYYKNETTARNPAGVFSTRGPSVVQYNSKGSWSFSGMGMYGMCQNWGSSINTDAMLNYTDKFGDFMVDALAGGSIFYYQDREQSARTMNGLAVPGWYSLANAIPSTAAGIDAIQTTFGTRERQVNSIYGKLSLSWKNGVFVDLTGRNDWSSTQPSANRSYFYPSVASSVVLTEFFDVAEWLSLWKLRGSWTMTKTPLGIYADNLGYETSNSWGGTSASIPSNLLGTNLLPSTSSTWEIGTSAYFFGKRLNVDIAYFSKLFYNQQINQTIAQSSGYNSTLINTKETFARRGFELTLSGSPIVKKDFNWHSMLNISKQNRYFVELDPVYSANNQWTQVGKRVDYYAQSEKILRDPYGNFVHQADGRPQLDDYDRLYGYRDPDFTFGFVNTFTYKRWTLGMSIDGSVGGWLDNHLYGKMFDSGSAPETDTKDRYDEVVNNKIYIGPGVKVSSGSITYDVHGNITEDTRVFVPNDIPVSYQSYMRWYGNSWEGRIHEKTFIKLRELSIGYSIPPSFLKSLKMKEASVAITGQNLLLWTKDFKYSDPDRGVEDMNAPSQRLIGVNIKIGL